MQETEVRVLAGEPYDFTQHVISCFYMFIDPRSMQEMTLLTTGVALKILLKYIKIYQLQTGV